MKSRILVFFLFVMVILTACASDIENGKLNMDDNTSNRVAKHDEQNIEKEPLIDSKAEVMEGDFVYRLVSKKSVYAEGEKVEVYAELEYVGDKPEMKITHAASPFYFPMEEKTRGYSLPYMMDQPLIVSILKKGEPLMESFKGAGGYGSEDSEDYIEFIKSVWEANQKGTLPLGEYHVSGSADFNPLYNENEENERIRLKAEIVFTVK